MKLRTNLTEQQQINVSTHESFLIAITHTKQEAPRMKTYVYTQYHIAFETHPTFKSGFSGEKKFFRQIHFILLKIYYSFSEETCSARKIVFLKLWKSEKYPIPRI